MNFVFTSGYTSDISNTNDYAIKLFPKDICYKVKESLEIFLRTKGVFQSQNSKIEIETALIWSCDHNSKIDTLLPVCIDHNVVDHVQRKTFKLEGSLFFREKKIQRANWCIAILSDKRREQINSMKGLNFNQVCDLVSCWPEFSLINNTNKEAEKAKKKNFLLHKIIYAFCFSFFLSVVLCGYFYNKQQILLLKYQKEQHHWEASNKTILVDYKIKEKDDLYRSISKFLHSRVKQKNGIPWKGNHQAKEVFKNFKNNNALVDLLDEYGRISESFEKDYEMLWKTKDDIDDDMIAMYYIGVLQLIHNCIENKN